MVDHLHHGIMSTLCPAMRIMATASMPRSYSHLGIGHMSLYTRLVALTISASRSPVLIGSSKSCTITSRLLLRCIPREMRMRPTLLLRKISGSLIGIGLLLPQMAQATTQQSLGQSMSLSMAHSVNRKYGILCGVTHSIP